MEHVKNLSRRIAALLLALCMLCLFAACQKKEGGSAGDRPDTRKPAGVSEDTDVILPYSREEGVNPFTCTSLMNEAIMPLIYDGLYAIDASYKPEMSLVENITVNGRTLMLTVNSERRFSDGSVITADDIAYSFRKAKNSTYYSSMLNGIAEATAGGTTTINFTLTKPNQYITANLTFPIVKAGTADRSDDIPVGSGRYVYNHFDAGGVLKKSDQYGDRFKADEIYLLNIPDKETLFNSLNIETVNAAVDDISDGELDRITASTTRAPLGNLVYIGINDNGALADASVRQAINAIVDRKAFVSSGMSGYAVSSDLPLAPEWFGREGIKTQSMDRGKAKDLLASALAEQPLKIVTVAGNPIKEQLAAELAKELKAAGVTCEVEADEPAVFRSAVKSGLYDLYIGEYRVTNDMDITGVIGDKQLESSWDAVLSGTSNVETFVKAFYKQMPFVTIGFRTGVLAYSRNLKTEPAPLPGNPYANVCDWTFTAD